jgi:hypothetical protein
MARAAQENRRLAARPTELEARGGLWSLPDGHRLPNLVEAAPLVMADPTHPARLRPSDLERPEDFHHRLTTWLLRQG